MSPLLLLVGAVHAEVVNEDDGTAVLVEGAHPCLRAISGHLASEVTRVALPEATAPDVRRLQRDFGALVASEQDPTADEWLAIAERARAGLDDRLPVDDHLVQRWIAASALEAAGSPQAEAAWRDLLVHHPSGEVPAGVALRLASGIFDQVGCADDAPARARMMRAEELYTRALASRDPEVRVIATRHLAALDVARGHPLEAVARLERTLEEVAPGSAGGATDEDTDAVLGDLVGAWALSGLLEGAPDHARAAARALGRPELEGYLLWRLGAEYAGELPPPQVSADAAIECARPRSGAGAAEDAESVYRTLRLDSACLKLVRRASLPQTGEDLGDVPAPPSAAEGAARALLASAAAEAARTDDAARASLSLARLDLSFAPDAGERLTAELAAFEARCPIADPAARQELSHVLGGLAEDTVDSAESGAFLGETPAALAQAEALARTWLACFPEANGREDLYFTLARAQRGRGEWEDAVRSADEAVAAAPRDRDVLLREAAREAMLAAGSAAHVDPTAPWVPGAPDPARDAFATRAMRFADLAPTDPAAVPARIEAAHQWVLAGAPGPAIEALTTAIEATPPSPATLNASTDLTNVIDASQDWQDGAPALARAARALSAGVTPEARAEYARIAEAATSGEFLAGVEAHRDVPPADRADWIVGYLDAHPDCAKRLVGLREAAADYMAGASFEHAADTFARIAADPAATHEDLVLAANARRWLGHLGDAAALLRDAGMRFGTDEDLVSAGDLFAASGDTDAAHATWLSATAATIDPTIRARAFVHMARASEAAGDTGLALRQIRRALAVAPPGSVEQALATWLRLAWSGADDEDAYVAAEHLLERLPDTPEAAAVREEALPIACARLDAAIAAFAARPGRGGSLPSIKREIATLIADSAALEARAGRLNDPTRYGEDGPFAAEGRLLDVRDAKATVLSRIPAPDDQSEGVAANMTGLIADQVATWQIANEDRRRVDLATIAALPPASRPYGPALFHLVSRAVQAPELEHLGAPDYIADRDAAALAAQLDVDPGNDALRARYALALLAAGRAAAAELVAESSPNPGPTPVIDGALGAVAWERNAPSVARVLWRRALDGDPTEPAATRGMGLLAARAGDWAIAAPLLTAGVTFDGDPARDALTVANAGLGMPVDLTTLPPHLAAFVAWELQHDARSAATFLASAPPDDPLKVTVLFECGPSCADGSGP
jgi:tetratricopeptide (TPR) repeat protein